MDDMNLNQCSYNRLSSKSRIDAYRQLVSSPGKHTTIAANNNKPQRFASNYTHQQQCHYGCFY